MYITVIHGGVSILRVISGSAKGHKLKTIKGDTTRPTSDKVKGSLFNIIADRVWDANVLDIYAGTGNLGIEALSRGAKSAIFIDKSTECANVIKENLLHTKLIDNACVLTGFVNNVLMALPKNADKFDIIFMDPPYHKNLIEESLKCIIKSGIINDKGIVIAERDVNDSIPEVLEGLILYRNQKYGDTILSFYEFNENT